MTGIYSLMPATHDTRTHVLRIGVGIGIGIGSEL